MGFTGTGGFDRLSSTTIAAVFGGIASQATGSDFYEGAMRAAFVHLFNELAFNKLQKSYEGKSKVLKNFKKGSWLYKAIDGASCGARMSNCLNRAGYSNYLRGKGRFFRDINNNKYMIGAGELATKLGIVQQINSFNDIVGKVGILYVQGYYKTRTDIEPVSHIDLVIGSHTVPFMYFWEKTEPWRMVGNNHVKEYEQSTVEKYFLELK